VKVLSLSAFTLDNILVYDFSQQVGNAPPLSLSNTGQVLILFGLQKHLSSM